jgi:cytochrome c oxidase subunit 2
MLKLFFNNYTFCNSPTPWQLGFQEPATPVMEGIINFHHDLMFFLIFILIFVSWILGRCVYFFIDNPKPEKFEHNTKLEIVWTMVPIFILISIALPSLALLYAMEEVVTPSVTFKAIGHQWYWSYEFTELLPEYPKHIFTVKFDSYMVPSDQLKVGELRLLEVDNRIALPTKNHIRVLVTSSDVIHSWAVPSLGVKIDAIPGRLNQTKLFIKKPGVYFGQCSEICGVNHAFMPIAVEAKKMLAFHFWFTSKQSVIDEIEKLKNSN